MNLRLLCIAFIVCSFTAMPRSMAQAWLWAKSSGGAANENATAVTTDAAGNVYVTGSFSSAVTNFGFHVLTNTTTAFTDIFVVKYDVDGNVQWASSAGGSDNDYATSISVDAWGNTYVAGYFYSTSIHFDGVTLTNDSTSDTRDMFITKYDAAGNVIWARRAGGTMDDDIDAVKTDVTGNVIVTGSYESKYLIFGTDTVKNPLATTAAVFVIKYDSAGSYLWARGSGGAGFNYANTIATDASGNTFIGGSFNSSSISFGSTSITNSGFASDLFLVKYDAGGTAQWAKHAIGADNDDILNAMSTDAQGNIYITGVFASTSLVFGSTTLTNAATGAYDLFVAKYNTAGNVVWAKRNGGANNDFAYALSVDDSSNVVIGGNFGSTALTFGSSTIINDTPGASFVFIAKYDSSGNALWGNSPGGSTATATTNGVATDMNGNVYLAGNFSDSSFHFGTNLLLNAINTGTTDMFLAKYSQTSNAVVNVNPGIHTISLYPNPANGDINVVLNESGYNSITIYDCLGRTVHQSILNGNERTARINTSDLRDGIYCLRAVRNGAMESATFVIRK